MASFGIKNTLRFRIRSEKKRMVDSDVILIDILEKIFKVKLAEIYAIQEFQSAGYFDVTLVDYNTCLNVYEEAKKKADCLCEKGVEVEALFNLEETMVTVHAYNPYMDMNLIVAFLKQYCSSIKGAARLYNKRKVFLSRYRFFVKWKTDPDCIGGVRQPPAVFSIAGDRGFLFYKNQPQYCRLCNRFGHVKEDCDIGKCCRNCGAAGHQADKCKEERVCDICRKPGHVARNCQDGQVRSFAEVARGEMPPDPKRGLPRQQETVVADTGEVGEARPCTAGGPGADSGGAGFPTDPGVTAGVALSGDTPGAEQRPARKKRKQQAKVEPGPAGARSVNQEEMHDSQPAAGKKLITQNTAAAGVASSVTLFSIDGSVEEPSSSASKGAVLQVNLEDGHDRDMELEALIGAEDGGMDSGGGGVDDGIDNGQLNLHGMEEAGGDINSNLHMLSEYVPRSSGGLFSYQQPVVYGARGTGVMQSPSPEHFGSSGLSPIIGDLSSSSGGSMGMESPDRIVEITEGLNAEECELPSDSQSS